MGVGHRALEQLRRRSRPAARDPGAALRMTVAVVGVGLIGGSVGLAAPRAARRRVRGYDPAPRARARARAGRAGRAAELAEEAVEGAETVFVAAPVGALPDAVGAALAAAGPRTAW